MTEEPILKTQDLNKFWSVFKDTDGFDSDSFIQLVEDTDEDTALKIIARFTETLREVEESLLRGRRDDLSEPIWRATHKIAGSANLIGFTKYGAFSRELSHQIRANPNLSSYTSEIESGLIQTQALIAKIEKTVSDLKGHL